jgi:hypothetical protein
MNQLRDATPPAGSSSSSMTVAEMSSSLGNNINSSDATDSFSDVDDAELSAALGRRITQIATSTGSFSSMDEEEQRQPLTGQVSPTGPCCCDQLWTSTWQAVPANTSSTYTRSKAPSYCN